MIINLFQMCILSPYDAVHWGNLDKTREEVLFNEVYLYLALAIEPWKYSSWCYFRSGIVHCASVATVVPSIPHYQVNSQRLNDLHAVTLLGTMTNALSNQAFNAMHLMRKQYEWLESFCRKRVNITKKTRSSF